MADHSEPTGSDPADTEVHELLTAAVARARAEVPPTDPLDVVAAARAARSSGPAKRHKMITGIFGVAAALLLVAVGVVVWSQNDRSSTQLNASGKKVVPQDAGDPGENAGVIAPALQVTPSTGLADGDEVTVVANGFDVGTEVTVLQCAVVLGQEAVAYACQFPSGLGTPIPQRDDVNDPATAVSSSITTRVKVSGVMDDLKLIEAPGKLAHEGIAPERVDCTMTSSGTQASPPQPIPAIPGEPNPALVEPMEPDMTVASADSGPYCVIVAMGFAGGEPTVDAVPIEFGTSSIDDPNVVEPSPGVVPGGDPSAPGPGEPSSPTPTAGDPRCPAPSSVDWSQADNAGPLLDFTPTSVIVCRYGVSDPTTATEITDTATLTRLARDLEALLGIVTKDLACTMEMGPSMALLASNGTQKATIQVEFYGCRVVANGSRVHLGANKLQWLWDATS